MVYDVEIGNGNCPWICLWKYYEILMSANRENVVLHFWDTMCVYIYTCDIIVYNYIYITYMRMYNIYIYMYIYIYACIVYFACMYFRYRLPKIYWFIMFEASTIHSAWKIPDLPTKPPFITRFSDDFPMFYRKCSIAIISP